MRHVDADKIDLRMPHVVDERGNILVLLSDVKQAITMVPTESVVGLWDIRKAFAEYIREMTVSKFETSDECKVARLAVKAAVNYVLGGMDD